MSQSSLQRLHSAVAMGRVDVRGRIDYPSPAAAPQRSSVATRIAYFESVFDNNDKIDTVKLAALNRHSQPDQLSGVEGQLPADHLPSLISELDAELEAAANNSRLDESQPGGADASSAQAEFAIHPDAYEAIL